MIKRHQSPSYIFARLRQIGFQYRHPDAPWLVPSAIRALEQIIRDQDVCVEFGSGRSTRWLAKRCKKVITVEHDPKWVELVSKSVSNRDNVEVFYRRLEHPESGTCEYVQVIEGFDKESVDLVLNDGKCRDEIAIQAIAKIRPGGILIIDNAERYIANSFDVPESMGPAYESMSPSWRGLWDTVSDWRRLWTSDGVSTTLILLKP